MTPQLGYQTMAIHILPNISRSKESQTMKFDQLIENSMINIFIEKSYTKCGGEIIPRHFSKKPNLSKVLYTLFLLYNNLRAIEI